MTPGERKRLIICHTILWSTFWVKILLRWNIYKRNVAFSARVTVPSNEATQWHYTMKPPTLSKSDPIIKWTLLCTWLTMAPHLGHPLLHPKGACYIVPQMSLNKSPSGTQNFAKTKRVGKTKPLTNNDFHDSWHGCSICVGPPPILSITTLSISLSLSMLLGVVSLSYPIQVVLLVLCNTSCSNNKVPFIKLKVDTK
jgi:hypothetical protein